MRPTWLIVTILALYVAGVAVLGIAAPGTRNPYMAQVFAHSPVAAILHLGGGTIALVAGAFQVNRRFRERSWRLHRRLGMLYVLGVVMSGNAALELSVTSRADLVARSGLATLALVWLGTTLLALAAIWRRDIPAHHRWMYRSYALSLSAVTLRIYMPASVVLGIPFDEAYRAVTWLCWVTNLVIVEAWFIPRLRPRVSGG
ncbi:MAG TPA: DUF2306 domain-containing protein [Gemmatimonadales bacterium]|nr:DUF2306 domain-containing protein [Gemmatimonadales bacterium]